MLDALSVARNEVCRAALSRPLALAAPLVRRSLRRRIARQPRDQESLRARYGIDEDTPVRPWCAEVERGVEAWAAGRSEVRFAYTSGTTSRPKKIAITPDRLRRVKRGSWEAAVQAGSLHGVRRPTLFVLAALERDASLSSMMLDEGPTTPFVRGLVMPSKYLWERVAGDLLDAFGPTACRLWLLALSNPGILYSTNPSTLAVFLERLENDWDASVALVRAFRRAPGDLPPAARRFFSRVVAPGWRRRIDALDEARGAPALADVLDGLRAYACWDGGYVRPFLERIRRFLPAPRVAHIPMYSMSTETVQTSTYYEDGRAHFLPLAPGVLYEFLPEGAPDDPRGLLAAQSLEPGGVYSMVVSDCYGLRRYQTADLFLCNERVRGLPDLHFLRRRGLAYSFTGEKLTGEQLTCAFDGLRQRFPALGEAGIQLTCVPSLVDLPHYRLVLACPGAPFPEGEQAELGAAFEDLLADQNSEWRGKRSSQRLGPVRVESIPYDDLARMLQGQGPSGTQARAWETQFKLVPITTRMWEDMASAEAVPK